MAPKRRWFVFVAVLVFAAAVGHDSRNFADASTRSVNLRGMYHAAVPSGTRKLYVSAGIGLDTNSGISASQPFATVQHAVDVSLPGDRILVGAGNYGYLSVYGKHGDAAHWLSIESQSDGLLPTISVADNNGQDGVDIQQSSYIGLYGFQIEGLQTSMSTNPSGVGIFRGSDHIFIWHNNIHDFPGGGVNSFYVPAQTYNGYSLPAGGWDLVDVSFNTIHGTSKYSPNNTSGISFYGAVDTTHATLDGKYGYRAVGNYIYDVICLVNSSSGAGTFPFVTDGNGVSVDSLDIPWQSGLVPYAKPGLIESNLITGVGGRAVHVYNSINVDGYFNTAVGNMRSDSPAINGGAELDSNVINGHVHYEANVILPLNTPNSTDGTSYYVYNVILGGSQAITGTNIDLRGMGSSYFAGGITADNILSGIPANAFTPVNSNVVPVLSGLAHFQTLGNGSTRIQLGSNAGSL